jgi:hypothetical protein
MRSLQLAALVMVAKIRFVVGQLAFPFVDLRPTF